MTIEAKTKRCTRCKTVRLLLEFRWLKKHHRGKPEIHRDSWCWECRRDYKRTERQRQLTNDRLQKRRVADATYRENNYKRTARYIYENREKVYGKERERLTKEGEGSLAVGRLKKRFLYKFSLKWPEYQRMVTAQQDRCAICQRHDRTKQKRLSVDHDHTTNKIRALLCHHCNTGLGNFFDSPALLMKAIQYLIKHTEVKEVS